jgi:putative transposase
MTISSVSLDELLKGCKRPEDLLENAGLMKEPRVRLGDFHPELSRVGA